MRRFFSLKATWPLWGAILLVTGALVICRYAVSTPWLWIMLTALGVVVIFLILYAIRYLFVIDRLLMHAECIPMERQCTSILSRLDLLIEETDVSNRRKYDTVIADTRAEIGALQSQINPHFLYNTLDSIRGQALIDGSEVIADMTEALSILFRYSISREGSLVTMQDELRCVEKYIMIQQFRFNHMLFYQKDIDPSLLSCMIPRLSLQPIVENAIFHGLEMQSGRGTITLRLYRTQNYMVVCVSDNGVGISAEKVVELNERIRSHTEDTADSRSGGRHSGIALTNVDRRIWLTFGENYGVHLFSTPGVGTDVEILLPLITSPDQIGSISEDVL